MVVYLISFVSTFSIDCSVETFPCFIFNIVIESDVLNFLDNGLIESGKG